jgi:DNA-binding NtrC family response regulator
MKDKLDSLVLQMYKTGMRCSEAVREFQKTFILTVLKDQRGNQSKAAEKLGLHRNTLHRTIRTLEIDIAPTRATGRCRPPGSELPTPSVQRRVG